MLPPYVMQENHALYHPLARHPLAVLRRHTFRSSDTTLVGPWLCCRKDLVHLSSLHCLPPRVMSLGARCEPTALCCCVLRWLLSNMPPPPSPSFSLPSQLCSTSPRRTQGAPTRPRTPFLLGSPPGAAPLPLASGAGMPEQRRTFRSCVPIGKSYCTMCLLQFYETRDRFRAADERMADAADERHKYLRRVHARFGLLCTWTRAGCGTRVRLRWSDVRPRWRMLGTELS